MCQNFQKIVDEIREQGIELGREEGIELGREQGIKLGKDYGSQSEKIETIKRLYDSGVEPYIISLASGLTLFEVGQVLRLLN